MSEPRAVVVAEHLGRAARRVLRDAGCSFIEGDGHSYLHPARGEARRVLAASEAMALAEGLLAAHGDADGERFVLFGPPPTNAAPPLRRVAHPVQLLEWLATVPLASAMHPGLKAYLYASDPDDILATLPFHDGLVEERPPSLAYPPAALVGVALVDLVGAGGEFRAEA